MGSMDEEGGALPAGLSTSDINTTINGEPWVHDLRLAEALGFGRPRDIRPLIERHREALERLGGICDTVSQNRGRGRPAREYWLTKKQAIYITLKAGTERATEITIQVVEVFDAATAPAPAPMLPAAPVPPFCAACAAADLWRRGINTDTDPNPLVDRPLSVDDLRVLKTLRRLIDREVDSVLSLRSLHATAAVIRILRGEDEPKGGGDA